MPGVLDIIQPMIIAYVHCRTQMFLKGGVKTFIKSHFKLLQTENHVFNYSQSFSKSCAKLLAKVTLTLVQDSIYSFYKETGCIKTIIIFKIEVRIQNASLKIFLTPL